MTGDSMTEVRSEVRSIAVYDRIADPMAAVRELGKDIAHSQMFGCQNEEQGRVLAMTCFAKRMDPLALAERYHLIQGRLSMRADAMLAGLHERGGSHRIIQRSDLSAEIEIAIGGDTQRFLLTWQEAQQEPFVWCEERINGKKTGKMVHKSNWSTPRSRMQMLWARVVSDGVRAMCPEVVCGSYAPEEILDFDAHGGGQNGQADTCQAGYVPGESVPDESVEIVEPIEQAAYEYATAWQVQAITDLFVKLQVPHESQEAILTKRNVKALHSLTRQQAGELLQRLQEKWSAAGQSRADTAAAAATDGSPATQVQVDEIKGLLSQVAQNGQPDIAQRVKAKLRQHGMDRLADLTMAEADALKQALAVRNLEAFFEAELTGHAGHASKN